MKEIYMILFDDIINNSWDESKTDVCKKRGFLIDRANIEEDKCAWFREKCYVIKNRGVNEIEKLQKQFDTFLNNSLCDTEVNEENAIDSEMENFLHFDEIFNQWASDIGMETDYAEGISVPLGTVVMFYSTKKFENTSNFIPNIGYKYNMPYGIHGYKIYDNDGFCGMYINADEIIFTKYTKYVVSDDYIDCSSDCYYNLYLEYIMRHGEDDYIEGIHSFKDYIEKYGNGINYTSKKIYKLNNGQFFLEIKGDYDSLSNSKYDHGEVMNEEEVIERLKSLNKTTYISLVTNLKFK